MRLPSYHRHHAHGGSVYHGDRPGGSPGAMALRMAAVLITWALCLAAGLGNLATTQAHATSVEWAASGMPGISTAPGVLAQIPPPQGIVPPHGGPAPDGTKQRIAAKAFPAQAMHRALRSAMASTGLHMAQCCLALRRSVLLFPFHFFW